MKEKRKVLKIVVCILFLFLVFMNVNQNIFAAVNTSYGENTAVNEPDLDKKVKDNMLLDVLGKFIYGVASMIEYLVGKIFEGLTGNNMFPWADKVIFNTVPLLDVNFLNPDSKSLFGSSDTPTMIATIVRSTYFTVLSLAIAFLGIVVGIMAIKLAVSAIASEKAKYKEAISNWLLAIVLLFTMHYALSFMFFANEKMVEVASSILTDNIKDSDIANVLESVNSIEDKKLVVNNFIDKQLNTNLGFDWISDLFANDDDLYAHVKQDLTESDQKIEIAYYLLNNSGYKTTTLTNARGVHTGFWQSAQRFLGEAFDNLGKPALLCLYCDVKIAVGTDEEINEVKDFIDSQSDLTVSSYDVRDFKNSTAANEKAIYNAWKQFSENGETSGSSVGNVISSMGQYFKESAWSIPTNSAGVKTGWDATNVSLQGAILYAIFVVQSMMFFFAYMKRFFYVIILAMLAPLVIIYDFFTKSIA